MKQTIQRNIPIPDRYHKFKWRDLMSKLKVGDSLVVPTQCNRQCALWAAGKLGIKVTSRKLNGEGFRVWRTE